MVVHVCNASTWEGRHEDWIKAILGYIVKLTKTVSILNTPRLNITPKQFSTTILVCVLRWSLRQSSCTLYAW